MRAGQSDSIKLDLQMLFTAGAIGGLPDAELLGRFIAGRDEGAFTAIVRRHGPMVMGVCRRVLRDDHDAEDAFQATFLVLACKAATVTPRELVANWLYGVAYQTALKVRAMATRRKAREKQVEELPERAMVPRPDWEDLRPVLDQELSRLPSKYRAPVILCHLEGKSYSDAARELGWPEGTVSGRLSRARELLAERLRRRGLAFSGGALVAVLSVKTTSAGVPTLLVNTTVEVARLFGVWRMVARGMISPEVAAVTQGVLAMMRMKKVALNVALLVGSMGGVGLAYARHDPKPPDPVGRQDAGEAPVGPLSTQGAAPLVPKTVGPQPVGYEVRWRLSVPGEPESLGPTVTSLVGQTARVHRGKTTVAMNGESIPLGLTFTAAAIPMQDGRVCVSVRAERTEVGSVEADGLRILGVSTQFVKAVKLGEAIELDLKSPEGAADAKPTRMSVTIVGRSER